MIKLLIFLSAASLNAQTFFGGGISAINQSSPKPSGWAILATPVSQVNGGIYSFSETDYAIAGRQLQTSVRTGVATPIHNIGPYVVYGLADAGMATVGNATTGAYAGGLVLLVPLPKTFTWCVLLGTRVIKTAPNGTQVLIELGFGRKGR